MPRTTGLAVLSSAALLLTLGGCQSDPNKVDLKSITSDLTPELMATSERPVDIDVNWAVNADQDLRDFAQLQRTFQWQLSHPRGREREWAEHR